MIEVVVEDDAWIAALPDYEALCLGAAQAALGVIPVVKTGEVAILLTCDVALKTMNADYRDKDRPTNVLSFPAHETAKGLLGDIALAYGVCAQEAAEQGKTLSAHTQHLVVHGVLHLLGYDHETDAEADIMEGFERRVLEGLGLPDPYA